MLFWGKKYKEPLGQESIVTKTVVKKEKPTASYSVCGEVLKVIYSDSQMNLSRLKSQVSYSPNGLQ